MDLRAPDVDRSEAVSLLSDLVAIDTRNPPGRERPCAEFVHETLRGWGIGAELVHEPYEERPQVVARIGRGAADANTLLLNGHMDIVPPGDPDEWRTDPFEPTLEDGRLYGRGACDMKAGLATALLAGRYASEAGINGTLLLTFTVGEETTESGSAWLAENLDADFGVVLEPTNLEVVTSAKGLAWYTVRIRGESCHASRPHIGHNPVQALITLSDDLANYQETLAERTHPLLGQSRCTPTVLSAGESENVVPSLAELKFDRRFLPGETPEELDDEMDALFDSLRHTGFEVTVKRTKTEEAVEVSPSAEIVCVLGEHAAAAAGVSSEPGGKVATTDQWYFANRAGIPTINWGPGAPEQAHTVNEWVETSQLVDAVKVLSRTIADVCGTET